jgi:hypothetical protein
MRLIDDWKTSYKKYSVIATAAIIGTTGVDQILPELLGIWESIIPDGLYPYAVATVATMGLIGRVVKQ